MPPPAPRKGHAMIRTCGAGTEYWMLPDKPRGVDVHWCDLRKSADLPSTPQ